MFEYGGISEENGVPGGMVVVSWRGAVVWSSRLLTQLIIDTKYILPRS